MAALYTYGKRKGMFEHGGELGFLLLDVGRYEFLCVGFRDPLGRKERGYFLATLTNRFIFADVDPAEAFAVSQFVSVPPLEMCNW